MCAHARLCVLNIAPFFNTAPLAAEQFGWASATDHLDWGGGRAERYGTLEEFETCSGFYTADCCIRCSDKCVISGRFFN